MLQWHSGAVERVTKNNRIEKDVVYYNKVIWKIASKNKQNLINSNDQGQRNTLINYYIMQST